jgi:hypothetical protein
VKERLLDMARVLSQRESAAGLSLEVDASDERPSIWNERSVTSQFAYLRRPSDLRTRLDGVHREGGASWMKLSTHDKHAFLALRLDAERFELTLRVPAAAWADVQTVRARLANDAARVDVERGLGSLPQEFVLAVGNGTAVPACEATGEAIARALDEALASGSAVGITRAFSRAEAIARGATLLEDVTLGFDALVPVYRLFAWQPDDDVAGIAPEIERERASRDAHVAELAAREAENAARVAAETERRREAALHETRERMAAMERPRPSAARAWTAPIPAPAPRPSETPRVHREAPSSRPAESAAPARWIESADAIATGGHVRIRRGPFTGKVATVVEIDAKGQAKVAFGLWSVRLDLRDLVSLAPER